MEIDNEQESDGEDDTEADADNTEKAKDNTETIEDLEIRAEAQEKFQALPENQMTTKNIVKRRPWNKVESGAVLKHFSHYVKTNTSAPGKQICMECKDDNKDVLKERSWKDIKYFVYNYMKKINKD